MVHPRNIDPLISAAAKPRRSERFLRCALALGLFASVSAGLTFAGRAATIRPPPCQLGGDTTGVVTAVSDGDTVVLDGKHVVRLAALIAPKGGDTPMSGDLADASRRHLEALVLDRTVVIHGAGGRQDRYGRTVAHLSLATDGTWVQQNLVREGLARVVTGPQEGPCAVALLGVEEEARRSERGVWAHREFAVRSATDALLTNDRDRFVVVAGRVYSVRRAGRLTYINFGADHSRSLTATLPTSDEKLFINHGKDPGSLVGQRVEMRGWIDDRGGPTMSLSHPDEIVVIGK